MTTQITLTLPDQLWERAEVVARRTGRQVADVLTETIELTLDPLAGSIGSSAFENASDEEVQIALNPELDAADDQRLSELLDRQQAGIFTPGEDAELQTLMQVYQQGLLQKAQALREAVRRGLREPPRP